LVKLRDKKLGEILLARGAVTQEDLERALAEQRQTKAFLGQTLLKRGVIKKRDLAAALQDQLGLPYVELAEASITAELGTLLPESMVRAYRAVPFELKEGAVAVAMADPLNLTAIESMRLVTGLQVKPFFAPEEDVLLAINQLFDGRVAAYKAIADTSGMQSDEDNGLTVRELERMVEDAPVVRLVDSIVQGAIADNASDIHVEPTERDVRVRYRVDGVLYEMMQIPKRLPGVHAADHLRRKSGDEDPGQVLGFAAAGGSRISAGAAGSGGGTAGEAVWDDSGYRSHRLGEDDHSVYRAQLGEQGH